ncbi:MAG: hypothetical protein J6R30_06525 [Bacteroidales bacterium]|nr:hypothetical protein [Bacteroidales bacterium]
MKKIYFILTTAIIAILFACVATNKSEVSSLLESNVEALADNENGYGWLWEKHWVTCETLLQIVVESSSGSIQAGTYAYNTQLIAELQKSNTVYTIIGGSAGQKSYCYDGWSFCLKNECR